MTVPTAQYRVQRERERLRQTDSVLMSCADLEGDDEVAVTLFVGGTIVTGFAISPQRWVDLSTASAGEDFKEQLREQVLVPEFSIPAGFDIVDATEDETAEAFESMPRYIHLREARYLPGSTLLPDEGSLWRGKLTAVDGWHFGNLGPSAPQP